MKKTLLLVIAYLVLGQIAFGQNPIPQSQRTLTNPVTGRSVEHHPGVETGSVAKTLLPFHSSTPGINWNAIDGLAIDNSAKVSSLAQKSVAGWTLNNHRISLYGTSSAPLWEVPATITSTDVIVDMNEGGTTIAEGYSHSIAVYSPASATPVWSATLPVSVSAIKVSGDGLTLYAGGTNDPANDSSFVYCYTIGQTNPVWIKKFPGTFASLVINKSATHVIAGVYGSGSTAIHVLNGTDGTGIFDAPAADQYPPAISDDGKYIVNGDFTGLVYLYEYDNTLLTYNLKWTHKVNGTNSWVCGMSISADGSTIAIGTMVFLTSSYDGELYVFDNNSPQPLWIYTNMGDMVQCTDVSSDGSIIAAGGWGPFDNSGPDFFLFRRQSNVPYFTLNTAGSLFCMDLSDDGKVCVTGGKAVHARAFGNGGNLYNINSDPGGGILTGHAVKSGSSVHTGVKAEIFGLTDYFGFTNDSSVYNIRYIPAGIYSVRYSAIGYIPQVLTGVEITDGQSTIRDVTLLPVGNPPMNLDATQGADLFVKLTWDASSSSNITGYNVYRKQYSFSDYPLTPIGTTAAGVLTYNDNTALPLTHYYYAVTAKISDSLQSPYSNDAIGWIASGYITNEISAYAGSTPVIDGILSSGEWDDAFRVDISDFLGIYDNVPEPIGSVTGYFKVNAALTELYVAVENLNDAVLDDHDEVALYVDDNHDGVYPPSTDNTEGNYWAVHYATGDLIRYRPIYNTGGVGTTVLIPNAQVKVSAASGHVVYEFVIPLGVDSTWQIHYNGQNQSGIFAFALDDPSMFNGWWPCTNSNIFNPAGYGVITFGATDQVPPPPDPLTYYNGPAEDITLQWPQPAINDFDHFNIYESVNSGTFTKIDETIGVEYFLTVANGTYQFYVTTVDMTGHESIPSNTVTIDVTIGVPGDAGAISMIKVGPNPFKDQLIIDLKTEKSGKVNAGIYDLNGNLVFSGDYPQASAGYLHISWNGRNRDGNDLPAGIYSLVIRAEEGRSHTFKLIKTR